MFRPKIVLLVCCILLAGVLFAIYETAKRDAYMALGKWAGNTGEIDKIKNVFKLEYSNIGIRDMIFPYIEFKVYEMPPSGYLDNTRIYWNINGWRKVWIQYN